MTAPAPGLTVTDLTVRFGGLTAVDGVALNAPAGRITGLIGPNGAGKTTTFNACTGIVKPTAGRVTFGDRDLTHEPSARRAQLGLGRTFQRMELFDSLTVAENVRLGPELRAAGRRAWSQLRCPRSDARRIAELADEAMARCGVTDIERLRAGALSTGQRRLVELARAIASGFDLLLLDEPSSGLDVAETERFGDVIEGLVAASGIGILIVEHDMALVRRTCSFCYVLEFGHLITEGPTSDVLASDLVRAAYLGSEAA